MLIIHNVPHKKEVHSWAKENGHEEQLVKKLDYLATFGECHTRCHLHPEAESPHGFYFVMEKKDDEGKFAFWFNGGLIYHEHSGEWGVHT